TPYQAEQAVRGRDPKFLRSSPAPIVHRCHVVTCGDEGLGDTRSDKLAAGDELPRADPARAVVTPGDPGHPWSPPSAGTGQGVDGREPACPDLAYRALARRLRDIRSSYRSSIRPATAAMPYAASISGAGTRGCGPAAMASASAARILPASPGI